MTENTRPINTATVSIDKLNPALYNPRKDLKAGDKEYEALKKSITEFGYIEPIIWNKTTGNVVGGHQRLKAMTDLGHTEVDVVVVEMDETQEKLANIALNKIHGDWEFSKLADLLTELDTGAIDIDVSGFDQIELEKVMTYVKVDDYSDLDKQNEALVGNEDASIVITVPKKHYETVVDWITDNKTNGRTSAGMGRGLMTKCGLL